MHDQKNKPIVQEGEEFGEIVEWCIYLLQTGRPRFFGRYRPPDAVHAEGHEGTHWGQGRGAHQCSRYGRR